ALRRKPCRAPFPCCGAMVSACAAGSCISPTLKCFSGSDATCPASAGRLRPSIGSPGKIEATEAPGGDAVFHPAPLCCEGMPLPALMSETGDGDFVSGVRYVVEHMGDND